MRNSGTNGGLAFTQAARRRENEPQRRSQQMPLTLQVVTHNLSTLSMDVIF